jgi:hypothetical protein
MNAFAWLAVLAAGSASGELEPLPERQRLVAIALAVGVLVLVVELLRRRKLREEYSWVWVATALLLILLAINGDLIVSVSRWIGAATSTSTLFAGCLLFLLLLALQFSVRLSKLTHRNRVLGQRQALLEAELERLTGKPLPEADDGIVPLRKVPPPKGERRSDAGAQEGVG